MHPLVLYICTTFLELTKFINFAANGIEGMITNGGVDPFDGNKSRKSSGFSDGTNGGGSKSRQYSGYEMQNKSRNCSGNSISAGLVSAGNIFH